MEETKEDRVEYKIYQIVCNKTKEIYIGKTIQTLQQRLSKHKFALNCTSRQIILRCDYKIEQIDSTFDEEESIKLERYYIETFECVNVHIPGRIKKEYREELKEEYMKKYREEYREEISKKKKEYREAHKEEISEYNKKWREAHKEEIIEKRKQKYTCECGSTLLIVSKTIHEKTKKHIDYINSKK